MRKDLNDSKNRFHKKPKKFPPDGDYIMVIPSGTEKGTFSRQDYQEEINQIDELMNIADNEDANSLEKSPIINIYLSPSL